MRARPKPCSLKGTPLLFNSTRGGLSIKKTSPIKDNLKSIAKLQANKGGELAKATHLAKKTLQILSDNQFDVYHKTLNSVDANLHEKQKAKSAIILAKRAANKISNHLFTHDDDFRQSRIEYIKKSIQESSSLAKFENQQLRMQYRFVMPHDSFGTPSFVFTYGMQPSMFRVSKYHPKGQLDLEIPYVMDAINYNCDRTGWTFGTVPTSSNILYSAEAKFISRIEQASGFLYAVVSNEAACMSNCIHADLNSNALKAEEYINTHIDANSVFAVREIRRDGRILDVAKNPRFNKPSQGDAKFEKFFEADTVDELRVASFLRNYPNINSEHDAETMFQLIRAMPAKKLTNYFKLIDTQLNFSHLFHKGVAKDRNELLERHHRTLQK